MDMGLFLEYIEPNLLVLVPTLWGIGMVIKVSPLPNRYIPIVLMIFSCLLSGLHLFATQLIFDKSSVSALIFAIITQGSIIWLISWYGYEKMIRNIVKDKK